MSYAKFVKIRRYLHFARSQNGTTHPYDENHDRIYKIRPVVEYSREIYSRVPFEELVLMSIAQQKVNVFQTVLPAKSHKWGIQFFVLCGSSGYSHDFEVYTGKENDPSGRRG